MSDLKKHGWKLAIIVACYLLASHWDYQDSQRIQSAQNWARVAHK